MLRNGGRKRRFPSFRRMGHSYTRNVRIRYSTGLNSCIELDFISRGEANRLCLNTRGAHIFQKFRNKLKILSASSYFRTEGPQALISTVYIVMPPAMVIRPDLPIPRWQYNLEDCNC